MIMKSIKKIFIVFLVSILCIPAFFSTPVSAEEGNELLLLEQWIEENDTSRIEELEDLLEYYYSQIELNEDPIQKEQYSMMAESVENMLTLVINEDLNQAKMAATSTLCIRYELAGATIIAYFKAKGYTLSANMLSFAFSNTSTNTTYTLDTASKNKILTTSWYKSVKGKYPVSGSSAFGDVMDLYYSINKFNYSPSSLYGYLNVTDRYDYAFDTSYPSTTGIAVNMMAIAQGFGCLVPYKVSTTVKVV